MLLHPGFLVMGSIDATDEKGFQGQILLLHQIFRWANDIALTISK